MAESAVLLPARLETRFDEVDGVSRLRVIVVPDGCWFDRRHGATQTEIDLLVTAVGHAGGALLAGQTEPEGPNAAAAFAALAGAVGAARALWLGRMFPARRSGATFDVDPDAGPRDEAAQGTAISGLPSRLDLIAETTGGPVPVATLEPLPRLVLDPEQSRPMPAAGEDDDREEWWPQWPELVRAGLAKEIVPSPVIPDEVITLYAFGLGDASAADVLDRHLATGDLGLLEVGQATNTVAGSPTVDLGRDPESWRALAARAAGATEARLGHAVAGAAHPAPPLPGNTATDHDDRLVAALVATLFPALAAHTLREHWTAWSRTVAEVNHWAIDSLRPDGPVAPIRIGRQPYGVWPVAAWTRWQADGVEAPVVHHAVEGCDALVTAAHTSGVRLTVADASAEEVWDLLGRSPTTAAYEARLGVPAGIVGAISGDPDARQAFFDRFANQLASHGLEPSDRAVIPVAEPWTVPLGLVLPRDTAEDGAPLEVGPWVDVPEPMPDRDPWRWIAACCAELGQAFTDRGIEPARASALFEDIRWWPASLWWRLTVVSGMIALDHALREQDGTDGPLPDNDQSTLIDRIENRDLTAVGEHAGYGYQRFLDGLRRIAVLCEELGDRALPLMERTVAGLVDTASYRVDPWLTGAAWRRLEQSSEPTRPVGLYTWVDGPLDGEPGPDLDAGLQLAPSYQQAQQAAVLRDKARRDPDNRWDVQVTSDRVRAALRLADDVRSGAHPAEAVGREVERLIARRATIDGVREAYPMRTEHAGRRTCDGLAVLEAARAAPADLAALGVDADTIDAIASLDEVLDSYADLLLVEAVDHAVDGRAEAAAHALDAAAGLAVTPDLSALATPSQGRSVRTTVLSAVPAAGATDAAGSPVAAANPSFSAWLAEAVGGDPDGPEWTCGVDGDPGITFLELGYTLADSLFVPDLPSTARLARALAPSVAVMVPPRVQALRDAAAGAGARMPSSLDLGLAGDEAVLFDGAAAAELAERLTDLRQLAGTLRTRLEAASSDDERRSALVDAARWGIPPPLPFADGDVDLVGAVEQAAHEITARLDATDPAPTDDATTLAGHVHRLFGGDVPLALPLDTPPFDLHPEPTDDDGRPRIDRTWLEVVAAVRPPLARLDALQHERVADDQPPLGAASTHPGEPWLGAPDRKSHDVPHLAVAYAPADVDVRSGARLAWSVVDSFAEVVPTKERTAGMAMRFNAPAAQAPNAILVAVTPEPGVELDDTTVLQTLREARAAAQARMVRQEDLREMSILSGPWLPAIERGGFQWQAPASQDDWP